MNAEFPRAKVHLLVAEELFHLMPDGTDMRFLHQEAVMPEETRERVMHSYGEYLGREMKCAVFDWGTRCKNPLRHYNEFLEFSSDIKQRKLDTKSRGVIDRMESETEKALVVLEKPL